MDLIKNQEQQKQTNVFQLEEVKQAEKQRFSLPDEAHKTLDAAEDQKLVQNAWKTVGKNMPPQYSEEAKKKKVTKATGEIPLAEQKKAEREKAQAEEVTEGMDSFPVTLQNAVLALATWGKVKAESSGPVKEAAERLGLTGDGADTAGPGK